MLFSKYANCQSYLDSTSKWYEFHGGSNGITYYKDYNNYYLDGDTIIAGNNYYKLFWNQIDSVWDAFSGSFLFVNYYNNVYLGSLREDSLKRFYIMFPTQSVESLQFDFNLSTGDSLPNMNSNYGCNNPPNTVTYIDTVYLGTQPLKKFHLPPSLFNKSLYEGIGSSGGFIWSGSLCQAFEVGACLIAYKKGLDSLYINCGLGTTSIQELINKQFVNIFPNPASENVTIKFKHLVKKGTLNIFNALGKEIIHLSINSQNSIEFDLSMISSGVYFVNVFDGETDYYKKLIIEDNY
jgi:hypothetical protein